MSMMWNTNMETKNWTLFRLDRIISEATALFFNFFVISVTDMTKRLKIIALSQFLKNFEIYG